MPSLARKLLIIAAVEGLVLWPHEIGQRNAVNNAIQIEYKTHKIISPSPTSVEQHEKKNVGLEAHGIVGLLSVASYSFLIPITQREQVAQVLGKPIYAVTNVAVIPLSSQEDASRAISQAREKILRDEKASVAAAMDDSSIAEAMGSETDTSEISMLDSPVDETPPPREGIGMGSGIAENVIGKRGRVSKSPASWFFRRRWGPESPLARDSSNICRHETRDSFSDDSESAIALVKAKEELRVKSTESGESETPMPLSSDPIVDLMPKLLRCTRLIFGSRNFFFAYDYDLTRRFGVHDSKRSHLPLHGVADPLFFWNRHLLIPFIECGANAFTLPLIQGFVGQRVFALPFSAGRLAAITASSKRNAEWHHEDKIQEPSSADHDTEFRFLLTLISRRSIKRPGLRYLRRGVDDNGNTANTVETEQILSTPSWNSSYRVYSFLQLRGSIPLFFSQSPYSLKPTPVLCRSRETNQIAFDCHFKKVSKTYGKVQVVSLIEKHGGEAKIGQAYENFASTLNETGSLEESSLGFEWFDFHHECRGMKFENVRRLVDNLEATLDDFGETIVQDNEVLEEQKGIMRTNCMDCLDRTGVAQCAFGQRKLEKMLRREGFDIDFQGDLSTQWFNTLWADNGDAISRQYSSTAALKGDYTRTRKRNYRGALNDFGLTLSRYYNNIVNDYFSQACIDYLLGNVSTRVFTEFEAELQSADPGISVQKLRQNAIETSSRIVISDQSEDLIGGWTMLSPRQPNTLRTLPFEESVILLTDAAVYSCRFDWNTDKILSFERVDLRSIIRISYGTYVTSVLTDSQSDEKQNVGCVIVYSDDDKNALRVNTRSLQSSPRLDDQETSAGGEWDLSSWLRGQKRPASRIMAFKVLPASTSVTGKDQGNSPVSEIDSIRVVCEEIERAMIAGEGRDVETLSIIDKKDIISLNEARKRTGYLEHLVYDIKKLVWA